MFKQFLLYNVFCISCLFLSHVAYAQSININSQLLGCSEVSDNLARLTCFDDVVENNLAAKLDQKKQATSSVNNVAVSNEDIDAFGKEHLKKTTEEQAQEVTSITLTISALSKTAYGKWNISFVNGQKWQQKDSVKLSLNKGQRVVLTKGALSAVYLQKENSKKRIKVKRLK